MRLSTALFLTATLALGCSSSSGNGSNGSGGSAGSPGSGGSATGGSGAGGSATGGAAGSGGSGGSAGSAGGSGATDGGTADTYANFADGFFTKYCVSCHGPTTTDQARDYSSMTDITRDHAEIACGVATTALSGCSAYPVSPGQFPIGTGPKPTNTERDRLVAWIQAGMPQ